ncbi:glucose dehydrogenase [FAD, quinone]-like [Tribolium madens]|uniref:glucose dehydrogenase [FAD, quinone]-like n=1 Tax=Tribolium madens TaxID=41895 RepID=UPI001CF73C7A|nr:glucose dehydrogenase [FAD, quinone]-like [Tribolium madens]
MLKNIFILTFIVSTIVPTHTETVDEFLTRVKKNYDNARRSKRFIDPYEYPAAEQPLEEMSKYDFIVVGSGSSGSVIANRLTETNWTVLLLEVGEEATALTDIPVIAPLFQFTDLNWNYLMEKQENMCLGLKDQRMAWPRGRGLGGSTLINYMIHVRGNRRDYNRWAKMGNPGWSYRDIFQYFLKSEDFLVKKQDPGYHTTGGYLGVQDVPYRTPSAHAFVQAAQEAGHKFVDYNGKRQMGVSYVHATTRNGKRSSAEEAFLRPIKHRQNLKISTKSRVTKVLIDPQTRQAHGVEYIKNRKYHKAIASKEVILSAGAFNSPQILMLSGIGPQKHLQELGIPVLEDLPVGQKMYDHITFLGLVFQVNESIVSDQKLLETPESFLKLVLNGSGPLTTLGGVEALLYFKTNVSKDPAPYPDMELIFISGSMNTDLGKFYRKTFRITDEVYNTVWKPLEHKYTFSVLPMLVHPKSYGHLELKSSNPFHWPRFYGNYFTDPDNTDIKTFIAAIREVQRLSKMPTWQKYGIRQVTTKIPGCQNWVFDSDDYWECALRHVTTTLHHQVATCKMGPRNDPEAVVDPELKVYGVRGLRVADTSVIPIPLTAHTNVPAFMIGEKASDLIKETWRGTF